MIPHVKRIGIIFDKPDEYAHLPITSPDQFHEFEPESTIQAMESAIKQLGFEPVRLGGPLRLLTQKPQVEVIWNIGEGFGTRNREAWAPVLAELYEIPLLGSDALTLSISLDKSRTKQIARSVGIPTSDWIIADFNQKKWPNWTHFPAFVKPRYEGTAKGILPSSVVNNLTELTREVERQWNLYQQDILLEKWLPGAEYTCAVSGYPMKAHTVLERGIEKSSKIGIHALESKGIEVTDYELTHQVNGELERKIQSWSEQLCRELEVLDFARLDFKCDAEGNPQFLEINTLPTFAVDNTFAILAELEGKPYPVFLAEILNSGLKRLGFS
jgi:D-alanine-D-alanine ligase